MKQLALIGAAALLLAHSVRCRRLLSARARVLVACAQPPRRSCLPRACTRACREAPRLRRVTAGLLRTSDDDDDGQRRRLGTGRSVLLLLGRLLVSALLVYAGYSQVRAAGRLPYLHVRMAQWQRAQCARPAAGNNEGVSHACPALPAAAMHVVRRCAACARVRPPPSL